MCRWRNRAAVFAGAAVFAALFVSPTQAEAQFPNIGRAATPAEVAAWDIDVRPDFKGLPQGSGSVKEGQKVWDDKCASCHGTFGESNEVFTPIVGGTTKNDIETGRVKALTQPDIQRTTLMKLSTISTLWDYVRRAMPWTAPKTLGVNEVYAVVAYILNLGDIVPDDFVLSDGNIAAVQAMLPNRNGMTCDHPLWDVKAKPDVANVACMHDCADAVRIVSSLPEQARDAHGNLALQQRVVGPVRGIDTSPQHVAAIRRAAPQAKATMAELAREKSCLGCHGVDNRVVGPAFRDVAQRYMGQDGVQARLLDKLRRGGGGAWGALPMPPNPDLEEADAKALLAWILDGAQAN